MQSTTYNIDREKILDLEQRAKLIKTCKDKAELDLLHGRETWIKRYMLVDLALFTGLPVKSMGFTCFSDRAFSYFSGPTLTISISSTIPTHMWSLYIYAIRPNIFFSITALFPSNALLNRSATFSS